MPQYLAHIALIVRDYDEAIAWFTGVLGFTLVEDTPLEGAKRWVLVAPPGAGDNAATLLLARAATPEQAASIGNQAGGRVFLFLRTDDSGATITPSPPGASASSVLPPRTCTEQ
jgi:catechol 2,3-dioxygenase-like lactoylglutathione lyase family enzyme